MMKNLNITLLTIISITVVLSGVCIFVDNAETKKLEHVGPAVYSAIGSSLTEHPDTHSLIQLKSIEKFTINGKSLDNYFDFDYLEDTTLILISKNRKVTCIYRMDQNKKSNHGYYGKCFYPDGLILKNYKGEVEIEHR